MPVVDTLQVAAGPARTKPAPGVTPAVPVAGIVPGDAARALFPATIDSAAGEQTTTPETSPAISGFRH